MYNSLMVGIMVWECFPSLGGLSVAVDTGDNKGIYYHKKPMTRSVGEAGTGRFCNRRVHQSDINSNLYLYSSR